MSRRRRALVAATVLLPLAAVAGWWLWSRSLSIGERELVGVWRFHWDAWPPEQSVEYEFRADRTCVFRAAGEAAREADPAFWWRAGDTLTIRHPGRVRDRLFGRLGVTGPVDEVSELTPDGPGRFRYVGRVDQPGPAMPPVTGTVTRVEP